MIHKINHQSRATEVNAVSSRIIGEYKKTHLNSDPNMHSMFAAFETQLSDLTIAIKRSKAESTLKSKDKVRDNEIKALSYLVMGFTHHPDAEIKNAALRVKKVINNYGLRITSENYATESALINSLLGDLAKSKIQTALALLTGCPETVVALQKAQSDFETTRIAYEKSKAEEMKYKNATTIKKELVKFINSTIIIYLRAMTEINEPTYGAFARTLASIITDNNMVVKKRSTKHSDKEA